MPAPLNFGDIAFTPSVKAVQERLGSRRAYAKLEGREVRTHISPEEAEFIGARDSFYLSTVGENGWPYIQYRGGPKGFLRVLDTQTLAFADFRGNKQYISVGNVLSRQKSCLFLMDYPNQERLKIWAEAEISEDPKLIEKLIDPNYSATIERAFILHIQAMDWNCQKYIVQRFTPEEAAIYSQG